MFYVAIAVQNVTGSIRTARLHGRDYLVAPMTLVVPGVLDGSQGPLYYPADELSKHPEAWNGMPLVGYHPMRGQTPASARDPEILDRQGLGYVFNAHFSESLRAEGWFDLELTARFDHGVPSRYQILPRLRRGERVELSTGLYYNPEAAPQGAVFNGRSYNAIARDYRPDHVAVLPDAVGACSIQDGCGVLVNHHSLPGEPMPLTPEQKQVLVGFLTTNCSCWKKPGDVTILNSLPDDKLQELKDAAEKSLPKPLEPSPGLVLGPEQIKALADQLRPHLIQSVPLVTPPVSMSSPVPTSSAPVVPVPIAQPVTANEWLAGMPGEVRGMFEGLRNMTDRWKIMEDEQKRGLADRLVGNVVDMVQKQATHALLMNRNIGDLQMMVSLLPPVPAANGMGGLIPLFTGAPGGAALAGSGYDPVNGSEQDLLLPPAINWKEVRQTSREVDKQSEGTRNGK